MLNNPLSFSDPSGFSWHRKQWLAFTFFPLADKQAFRAAAAIGAAILTAGAASAWMSTYALANGATVFASAADTVNGIGAATAAAAGGFASGGINGGNIQSALRGAFMAAVTAGVVQGLEGLSGGAGGAEGGLAAPSPAIDYLRSADGTATGFAGPASLGDWYPNAQGQFEVVGKKAISLGDYSNTSPFSQFMNSYVLRPENVIALEWQVRWHLLDELQLHPQLDHR